MRLCKVQMSKGLFLLKKVLNILLVQKKVVPLQTFCMMGTMQFSFRMGTFAYEKPNRMKVF